jgi:hypothetical protein
MKIKTITCHEVYNHGASLQEFALLQYLKNIGHNAQTIHYKPNYLSGHFKLRTISNPRFDKPLLRQLYILAKLPGRIFALKRKKAFDEFSRKYINTDSKLYRSNEELKEDLPVADAYICGSDQIWNSFFQNGKDPSFYLNFVPSNKLKISYAASFAIDAIEESLKPFVQENIERIDKISVRESSGLKILEDLSITRAVQVLDPVFLIESKYWEETFVTPIKEKFIFVYDFESNKNIERISIETAKKHNLKIFTVNQNITYADKNFFKKSPEVFLSLISNANFIIGNSFHALAFSLIFNKIFFVVDRNEKINTRMRDFMSSLNLSYLNLDVDEFKTFDKVSINYEKVNFELREKIEKSQNFLKKALKNDE